MAGTVQQSRASDAHYLDILIVEDDKTIAGELAAELARAGHTATLAFDLTEARRRCAQHAYSVVILDRLLPDEDGLELIPWLRKHSSETGVLVLSALGELEAKVHGLNAGADDYLGKPYALEELLARLSALTRRKAPASTLLRVGPLALDRLARQATVKSRPIQLNHREFSLLEYFMLHVGQTVTRTMIVKDVWGYDLEPRTNVVDVHVSRLRSKLEASECPNLLITERGAGYRLRDPAA